MARFQVSVTLDLPGGEGIDATTAASLVAEQLHSEAGDLHIWSLRAEEIE